MLSQLIPLTAHIQLDEKTKMTNRTQATAKWLNSYCLLVVLLIAIHRQFCVFFAFGPHSKIERQSMFI